MHKLWADQSQNSAKTLNQTDPKMDQTRTGQTEIEFGTSDSKVQGTAPNESEVPDS